MRQDFLQKVKKEACSLKVGYLALYLEYFEVEDKNGICWKC